MRKYLDLLRNPSYVLFCSGQFVSQFGNALWDMGVVWLAIQMTGSPTMAGLVLVGETLPFLLFGMLGGAVSDRVDRRRLMIWMDLARGVLVALPWVLWSFDVLHVWHLIAIAALHTTLRAFFQPAFLGLMPALVEKEMVSSANALIQVSRQVARVLGPALTGLLLQFIDPTNLLLMDALTFFVSAATLLMIRPRFLPAPSSTKAVNVWADIVDVFRFTRGHRGLFWCISLFGVGLVAISALIRLGIPLYSDQILKAGTAGFGLMMSSYSLGSIVMGLVVGTLQIKRFERVIFGGWVFWGGGFAALAFCGSLWQATIVAAFIGAMQSVVDVNMMSFIHQEAPHDKLGKMFNLWSTGAWTGDALSGALMGPFMTLVGVAAAFQMAGLAGACVGLLGLWLVWRIQASTPVPATKAPTA